MKIYLFVWAAVLLALQGCDSCIGGKLQALETVAANEAEIYLYRTSTPRRPMGLSHNIIRWHSDSERGSERGVEA